MHTIICASYTVHLYTVNYSHIMVIMHISQLMHFYQLTMTIGERFDICKVCKVFILVRDHYTGVLSGKTLSHKEIVYFMVTNKIQVTGPLFT